MVRIIIIAFYLFITENYKSSLQLVFGMLKYKSNKTRLKKYINQNREKLEAMDKETYQVIGVLLHAEKHLEKYGRKDKEELSMCKAIEEMIEDGKMEGREEEKLRIAKELKGILSDKVISEKTTLPLEIVKNI